MQQCSIPAAFNQDDGVVFSCTKKEIAEITAGMQDYFSELGVDPKLVSQKTSADGTKVGFALNTPAEDTNTLNLGRREELGIKDETVTLPTKEGGLREITTVSKKEILFALFQHGRQTNFQNKGCKIQAFKDHIGIRQNIAAWTEHLSLGFDGNKGPAWHDTYWDDTPMPTRGPLHEAIHDIFLNQDRYTMGCRSATKVVIAHGILDYYSRIRPDPAKLKEVEATMLADGAPLTSVEPGSFRGAHSASMTPEELGKPGKLMTALKDVPQRNFIPGDWVYIKNTDEVTSQEGGYEGSNAVYLGRNNFDDYYGEMPDKHYSFEQKIDEVYQWRHGAYNSSAASQSKRKELSPEEFSRLLQTPQKGGLLIDQRAVLKVF